MDETWDAETARIRILTAVIIIAAISTAVCNLQ